MEGSKGIGIEGSGIAPPPAPALLLFLLSIRKMRQWKLNYGSWTSFIWFSKLSYIGPLGGILLLPGRALQNFWSGSLFSLSYQFDFIGLPSCRHRAGLIVVLHISRTCAHAQELDPSLPWVFRASPGPPYVCSHLVLMVVHSSPLTGSICHWNGYLATSPVPVKIPPWAPAPSALWSAISCAPKARTWRC